VLLSILIPALTDRLSLSTPLLESVGRQSSDNADAELIVLLDNRRLALKDKRNELLSLATGKFVSWIDDDDTVSPDSVVAAINEKPNADVICFDQMAQIEDGQKFKVSTSLHYENESAEKVNDMWKDIKRKPWHWCAWNAVLAKKCAFVDAPDEDWLWIQQMLPQAKTQHCISKVLHYYRYRESVSTFSTKSK